MDPSPPHGGAEADATGALKVGDLGRSGNEDCILWVGIVGHSPLYRILLDFNARVTWPSDGKLVSESLRGVDTLPDAPDGQATPTHTHAHCTLLFWHLTTDSLFLLFI